MDPCTFGRQYVIVNISSKNVTPLQRNLVTDLDMCTVLVFIETFLSYAVQCPPLTAPLNGHLSSDATVSGTVVEVTCNDGYLLDGQRELVCQSSGLWSTSTPACVQGLCCLCME